MYGSRDVSRRNECHFKRLYRGWAPSHSITCSPPTASTPSNGCRVWGLSQMRSTPLRCAIRKLLPSKDVQRGPEATNTHPYTPYGNRASFLRYVIHSDTTGPLAEVLAPADITASTTTTSLPRKLYLCLAHSFLARNTVQAENHTWPTDRSAQLRRSHDEAWGLEKTRNFELVSAGKMLRTPQVVAAIAKVRRLLDFKYPSPYVAV